MRASAFLVVAAGLALAGCKSNIDAPVGQPLTSCSTDEVLVGPSSAWSCKPIAALDFGSAISADSSPDAGEAQFTAHARRVTIADQAASLTPSAQVILQDGTFPLTIPNFGTLDFPDGGVFDVFGGPVLSFGGGHVTTELADTSQQTPVTVNALTTESPVVSTWITWFKTIHLGLRAWGTITGDGTPAQPAPCHIYLRVVNSDDAGSNWIATVADQTAPGFSDGGSSGTRGYTQWVLEGDLILDAGTYQISANLGVDDAGTCTAPLPPSTQSAPAELTVEEY